MWNRVARRAGPRVETPASRACAPDRAAFLRPLFAGAVLALAARAPAQTTFQAILGTPQDDHVTSIAVSPAGGYAVCGQQTGLTEFVLVDDAGFPGIARFIAGGRGARVLPDGGGFVIGGETEQHGPGWGLFWARLDSSGQWVSSFDYLATADATAATLPGLDRSPSGYVLVGKRELTPSILQTAEIVLTDVAGGVLVIHDYFDLRYGADTFARFGDVAHGPGVDYAVGSTSDRDQPSTRDGVVCRLGAGGVEWAYSYAAPGGADEALGVDLANDGDVLVCGLDAALGANGGTYVLRLDPTGAPRWRTRIDDFTCASSIEERANGEIVVAGTFSGHAALLDLAADGSLEWARGFGQGGGDLAGAVMPTPDGGLILAASTLAGGAGGFDFLLCKTDGAGHTGCDEFDFAPAIGHEPAYVTVVPLTWLDDLGSNVVVSESVSQQAVSHAPCAGGGVAEFCAGDGSLATACPCGNFGGSGRGCANSVEPLGAHLDSVGSPTLDDLVLHASGLPAVSSPAAVFFQGDVLQVDGVVFGDGLRCVDGVLVRLAVEPAPNGRSTFPSPGDVRLSTRGAVVPGSGAVRGYQAYYRNASAAFCPPATFNATNALRVVW